MEGFLGAKIQQNLELEIRLDDIKEAYRQLENSIPGDGKQLKHKIQLLERSLEQVSAMYQQSVNERSILKVDLQVAERKLQKSLQRQGLLEKKFEQQRSKNGALEKIVIDLKKEFIKMSKKEQVEKESGLVRKSYSGRHFAIKGGGGKRMQTPRLEQLEKKEVARTIKGGGTRMTVQTGQP